MSEWYILGEDCKTPVKLSWDEFLARKPGSSASRNDDSIQPGDSWARVAYTELPSGHFVSTVFLGLDHNHGRNGPPILFESMAFDWEEKKFEMFSSMGTYHEELNSQRYSTWDEAAEGHKTMVEWLEEYVKQLSN